MINKIVAAFFSAIICIAACGQNKSIDSLKQQLSVAKNDTSRVLIFTDLSFTFGFINSDSALLYAAKAIDLAKQIHFVRGEIRGAFCKASVLETNGEMPEALEIGFNALEMAQKANLLLETSMCLTLIGNIFYDLDDYTKAISFYQQATLINEVIKNQPGSEFWKWQTEINFGTVFMLNDQLDSSFAHLHKGFIETLHDDEMASCFSYVFRSVTI